jgi:hypothetical protein
VIIEKRLVAHLAAEQPTEEGIIASVRSELLIHLDNPS